MYMRLLTCRIVLALLSKMLSLTIGGSAFAQQLQGQWVEDLYMVSSYGTFTPTILFIDESNIIRKKIPSVSDSLDFPVPSEYRLLAINSYWHDDSIHTLTSGRSEAKDDGNEFKQWTFAKWQDDKWNFLGEYITDKNEFLRAIPCDNGRFIVISSYADLNGNNGSNRTPFVKMYIPDGKTELKIESSIAHGVDEIDMSDPYLFNLVTSNAKIIIAGKYAVLINCHNGLYWIFSLETASLKRAGRIFNKATSKWITDGGNSSAILCANPEKDGTILISTQMEEAIISETGDEIRELNELIKQGPVKLKDATEFVERRALELKERNPFVGWYRIYPETGKIEKADPIGAVWTRSGNSKIWRPLPDGSVKMGTPHYSEDEPKKQIGDAEKANV